MSSFWLYKLHFTHPPSSIIPPASRSEYAQGNWALQGEAIMPLDKTALHMAVDNGDVGVVTMLLAAGRTRMGSVG